uniref:Uncharacterized protein n=1 Tax=Panagrolaimus sp. PS1159 TaxID=55785 RepID=A0AC35EZZ2_9BILA
MGFSLSGTITINIDAFETKCIDQTIYINRILTEINELPNIRQIELNFSSPDSAADARIELLKVKESLAAYGVKIEQNLREADRLCHDGAEILTPEQYHALKEGREKLQNTYRNLIEYTDKILKRLDVATALLIEFSTKSSEFHSWIFSKSRELEGTRLRSGDPSRLSESKREAKQLYDDIIANGDKLREIRQIAVKIESEVRNYIEELKRQDPHAKLPPLHAQDVQNTVQLIQEDYEKLIHDSQLLIQFLNKLNSLSVDHEHNIQEVEQWLADLEASTSKIINNTKQSTPDEKLNILLNLSQDAIAKQPKIDEAIRSANDLLAATISTDAHDSLAKEQEMALGEIQRRFKNINAKINDSVDATRAEITKKDGVNQGIENILDWISEAEKDVKNSQNLPLVVEKLSNLKYEDQLKRSEMHSQEKILADIGKAIENLPNSEATKDLENKYANAEQRFKRVKSIRKGLSDNLHDVIDALNDLNTKNNGINKKLLQIQDDLDRIDATDEAGIQKLEKDLEQIVNNDWNELSGLAEKILSVPNVSESDGLHEMMNGTSKGITRAQKRLADKVNAGTRLATDKNAFSLKAAEIEAELSEIEENIQYQIRDVSIDDEVIRQKLESCKKIEQKLSKTQNDLEELERIEMDLIHASGANKRRSMILDGSSFGSAGESINQAKQQLSSLQKRQDEAEKDLHKLKSDLNETLEKRTKWNAKCDDLQRWAQNENSQLQNRANLSLDNLSLQTTLKEIKAADKRLREKQPELSELRQLSIHLIKKLPSEGHEDEIIPIQKSQKLFEDNFESLENENSSLELCIATANVFLNDSTSMEKWITAKMRVLDLCSVSADPNLISNHLALLDVLKNEIEDEKPKWQNLNETSESLRNLSKSNSFNNEVSDKMDNLNNKWKNLEDCVNSRTQDLNAAKSLGSKFNGAQKDFTKKLGELESAIDDITKAPINSDADIENQNKQIELIEKKLEAELEPLLFELTKLASEIEEITNDPATKSEAKNRSDSAKTAVDELKKKLDSVKKAAASAKSQGEELLTEFDKKLDWIRETQKDFDSLPAVSADPAKLNEQIEDFSSLYQNVLENEGSMVLARAKIADSLQKKPNSMLKRKLESFDEEWKPLLAGVKDRYQLMEKAKKLGDELADLEVKIKNDLNDASQKIDEAKSADSNGNEMPDLTPTENLLHSLRPSLDGLLSLAKNLEQIAPGPDAKKLNREAENLVADANNLTKECSNQLKLAKARNDLRNQFEKGVIASQILIENARNNSGLCEQHDSTDSSASKPLLSKEKLKLLADDLESNWIRQRRDLDSTANKLKPMIESNEIEEIDDALTDLDSTANKLKPMIESNEIEEIDDALTGLDMNYNDLKKEFGLASDEMQETESVIGQTSEKGRQLKDEVDELVDRIRELESIGRDSDTLKQQSDECNAILTEIEDKKQQLEQLAIEWKKLADSGKISGTQMIGPQKEMDQINNKLEQQKTKITKRKGEIEDMVDKINDLT